MLYFLEKAGKIATALGAPPPEPQVVTSTQVTCYFWAATRILQHR